MKGIVSHWDIKENKEAAYFLHFSQLYILSPEEQTKRKDNNNQKGISCFKKFNILINK